MSEDLLDYWLRIITPIFPSNAWIAARFSGGDHLIQIDWKLENDLRQPNRRSRKIEIIIQEESIDDYLDKDAAGRKLSDVKMKQWLSEHYNHLSNDLDAQASRSLSAIRWRISKDMLGQ